MIDVSNKWKTLQNQTLLPEMFVEITYTITEPGLRDDATVSSNTEVHFSETQSVVENNGANSENYTSMEYGLWGLDGGTSYFDGSPENPGYVSDVLSGDDGSFATHPTISIGFSHRHTVLIPGMTIVWSKTYNEWATDFQITTYNGAGLVDQIIVRGNTSPESTVWFDIVDYTRIEIEILKWSLPYHRARCSFISLGLKKIYTKDDLLGYEHRQSADLLSAVLPSSEITFRLRNDMNQWNPDNPTGLEQYLLEQQKVDVRYGMDVDGTTEWIPGGTFWLSEWSTSTNGMEAIFTAKDAIDFMHSTYVGTLSGTLYDIAVEVLESVDLEKLDDGSNRYFVDESLKSITTNFVDESADYTIAEVLQMVAHSGCCILYQDRRGVIRIEPWSDSYSNYMIEPSICYNHPEYTVIKPLKSVSVGYGGDNRLVIDVGSKGEVQTIDNPLISTEEDAIRVGELTKKVLGNRKTISGEFRADLRVDVLDKIIVVSKYSSTIIGVTEIVYSTTGGAFKGNYVGRVVSIDLEPISWYSGELYAGEV